MSAVTRPLGPLPARVYWTRRAALAGIFVLLVFGTGRVLGGGSDASSEAGEVATQVAAQPALTATTGTPSATATGDRPGTDDPTANGTSTQEATRTSTPLPAPDGPCESDSVRVQPVVEDARAGADVPLILELTSPKAACTWRVSPTSVVVRITSGSDFIWSTQDCPKALATQDVVVRRETPARVRLTWPARRSDDECSNQAGWVGPGWYHVSTAALAGEPNDLQFKLRSPVRPTVTVTPKPAKPSRKPSDGASQPTEEPAGSTGDGAREPD